MQGILRRCSHTAQKLLMSAWTDFGLNVVYTMSRDLNALLKAPGYLIHWKMLNVLVCEIGRFPQVFAFAFRIWYIYSICLDLICPLPPEPAHGRMIVTSYR